MKRRSLNIFFGLALAGLAILSIHGVDNTITPDDEIYLGKISARYQLNSQYIHDSYENQLSFIEKAQRAVIDLSPERIAIPFNQRREPSDLWEAKVGLCYDRSRTIEKLLKFYGFTLRHAGLYSTVKFGSRWKTLINKKPPSHSLTEVKTLKGWLVVDSVDPWISIDNNNNPVSFKEMKAAFQGTPIIWSDKYPGLRNEIYDSPFLIVYGLYSRHGRFYPPYNFIPDINWPEFLINNLFG